MTPNIWKRLGFSFLGGLIGIVISYMIVMIANYVPFWYFPPIEAESPRINYQVDLLSPGFEALWQLSVDPSYYYERNPGSIHLIGTEEGFLFLGSLNQEKYERLSLINLDLLTGEVKWQLSEQPAIGNGPATTIAVNGKFIYVGFEGLKRFLDVRPWANANVVAYDLNSREFIWSREIDTESIDILFATESIVTIEGWLPSQYYFFDSDTGDVIVAEEESNEDFVWFTHNGITYERTRDATIQAVVTESGNILWQSEAEYIVWQPPVLDNNIIVARSGQARFLGNVFGVDANNGRTLWEYPDIIGNVAVDNGIAYFLTRHIQLWAVDIETGERLARVSFSPDFHPDSPNKPYHVAAYDGLVLVYLGEGQQMFGFRSSVGGRLR